MQNAEGSSLEIKTTSTCVRFEMQAGSVYSVFLWLRSNIGLVLLVLAGSLDSNIEWCKSTNKSELGVEFGECYRPGQDGKMEW